jgi:hypothetical protein
MVQYQYLLLLAQDFEWREGAGRDSDSQRTMKLRWTACFSLWGGAAATCALRGMCGQTWNGWAGPGGRETDMHLGSKDRSDSNDPSDGRSPLAKPD